MLLYSLNKNPVIERKSCKRKMQIRIQNSCFWPILHHIDTTHCTVFFFHWYDAVPSPGRLSGVFAIKADGRLAVYMSFADTHGHFFSPVLRDRIPPWHTTVTVIAPAFCASDWTPLEASSPIELWEASGVFCLIELHWGAAAPYVFSLIELFPGPVDAGSARQSPLIFLNDVASVSVTLRAAAARRGLLWLTSRRDKQSCL